jgi:uncharacterized MAPEG superfamily protein
MRSSWARRVWAAVALVVMRVIGLGMMAADAPLIRSLCYEAAPSPSWE